MTRPGSDGMRPARRPVGHDRDARAALLDLTAIAEAARRAGGADAGRQRPGQADLKHRPLARPRTAEAVAGPGRGAMPGPTACWRIDGVFNRIRTTRRASRPNARQGRLYGFDGKSLIHPSQIEAANGAFGPSARPRSPGRAPSSPPSPSPRPRGWASIRVEGEMVERLHLAAAQALLAGLRARSPAEPGPWSRRSDEALDGSRPAVRSAFGRRLLRQAEGWCRGFLAQTNLMTAPLPPLSRPAPGSARPAC